jgi:hypothetical protein
MSVRVVPPDISIASIGQGKYGAYVDINNPNTYDLDLSQWKLLIDGSGFTFPKNTLIASNTTTRFSGVAMGFASTTVSSSTVTKILFPNLEEVTRYTPEVLVNNNYTSTTTATSTTLTIFKKPFVKITRPVTATTSTTSIQLSTSTNHKDTRIIAFFKSLFGK